MIDTPTLVTYMSVVLGLFLIPGPALMLILGRTATGGTRVGVATGLGIATGDIVHALMTTFGLSAILATSAVAFAVVKYAGAGYLMVLGLRAFFEKAEALSLPDTQATGPAQAFRQAIPYELLNPKTALFFLAFLPQFVHPANGPVLWQFASLGGVFVAMSAVYSSLVAAGAGLIGRLLRGRRGFGRWKGKILGTIFFSLGLRMALQSR